jgi:hypothetical protein
VRPPARGGRMWNMTLGQALEETGDGEPMHHRRR